VAKSHGTAEIRASDAIHTSGTAFVPLGRGNGTGQGSGGDGDDGGSATVAVPIALNLATVLKLTIPAMLALLTMASAAIYFYHRTRTHMGDAAIHLGQQERSSLETKASATASRKMMLRRLAKQANLHHRELRLEQSERIGVATEALRKSQDKRTAEVLKEVRRVQRAVEVKR
jgi:hypothetical protein